MENRTTGEVKESLDNFALAMKLIERLKNYMDSSPRKYERERLIGTKIKELENFLQRNSY